MRLLIQFPTRERPNQAINVLDKYINYLDDQNNCVINVNCDIDDLTMQSTEIIQKIKNYPQTTLHFNDNKSKVEAVNKNIKNKDFDIVIVASDDMVPVSQKYDKVLREAMTTYFPDGDGVLWFYDGYNKTTNTFPIMGRKYYERFNYVYAPSYLSLFCDNELQEVAEGLGKIKKFDQVLFQHHHPDYGLATFDNLYKKNYAVGYLDSDNYTKRKTAGFLNEVSNVV